jgi:hypothetical protein
MGLLFLVVSCIINIILIYKLKTTLLRGGINEEAGFKEP